MRTRTESGPSYAEVNRMVAKRHNFLATSAVRWLATNMPEVYEAIKEESYKRFPSPTYRRVNASNNYNYLEELKP